MDMNNVYLWHENVYLWFTCTQAYQNRLWLCTHSQIIVLSNGNVNDPSVDVNVAKAATRYGNTRQPRLTQRFPFVSPLYDKGCNNFEAYCAFSDDFDGLHRAFCFMAAAAFFWGMQRGICRAIFRNAKKLIRWCSFLFVFHSFIGAVRPYWHTHRCMCVYCVVQLSAYLNKRNLCTLPFTHKHTWRIITPFAHRDLIRTFKRKT